MGLGGKEWDWEMRNRIGREGMGLGRKEWDSAKLATARV